MKYLKSTAAGYKDIGINKSKFVAKTQILASDTNCLDLMSSQPNVEDLQKTFQAMSSARYVKYENFHRFLR